MHTNVLGAMQVMPQVLPAVEEADGVFAVLSSGLGLIGRAADSQCWLYRASKAALNMVVSSARFDYPKARCVALDPGWVQTDMGGPQASLSVHDSVADLRQVIARLTLADSGHFFHRDGRRAEHW